MNFPQFEGTNDKLFCYLALFTSSTITSFLVWIVIHSLIRIRFIIRLTPEKVKQLYLHMPLLVKVCLKTFSFMVCYQEGQCIFWETFFYFRIKIVHKKRQTIQKEKSTKVTDSELIRVFVQLVHPII